jgi:hypothetical protein
MVMTPNRVFSAYILILILIIILISACTRFPEDVEATLKLADKNSSELKSVLQKYSKNPADSLKYQAACFLIGNMKWHYGKKVVAPEDMWNLFLIEDSLVQIKMHDKTYWKSDQTLNGYKYLAKKLLIKSNIEKTAIEDAYSFDVNSISSEILINTIESAFIVKNLKWNRNLSFEEFCEYILPYRLNSEPVFDIRLKLNNRFKYLQNIDSLRQNPVKTISFLNQYINYFNWDWYEPDIDMPDLGFYNIFYWNISKMNCANHVAIQGQLLRSIGIPVTEVFTSKWNDSNSGHSWCGMLSDENRISLFSAIYENPDNQDARFRLDLATKFFMKTFAANKNTPYFLKSEQEFLPSIFSSPCIKDITATLVNTSNIELAIPNPSRSNNLAYFCSFINGSWDPIAWGVINHQNQTVKFDCLPIGLIGIPCIYNGSKMVPNGPLVKIHLDGDYSTIEPDKSHGTLTLYRKFPQKARLQYFTNKIIGTVIEGANKADFSDAIKLSTIKDTLIPYLQDYSFINKCSYRYYRVISPEFQSNIAELEFLTEKKEESGSKAQPLPIFGLKETNREPLYEIKGKLISENSDNKAFDHDLLTFTAAKWLGIDLGLPKRITKIRLAPRNANNGIVIDDTYELFYWDKEWKTKGTQKAQYNFLQFYDIPLNTYYWLRNISNGREEEPFNISNGKQVFISGGFDIGKEY